jgi:hypothetical protein
MEDIIYLLTKPVSKMKNSGPKTVIRTLPSSLKEKRGGLERRYIVLQILTALATSFWDILPFKVAYRVVRC